MYAIFRTGGHQYRVAEGDMLDVERLDAAEGDALRFEDVLLIGGDGDARVGTPTLTGAAVRATVLGQVKGEKLTVFKYKRKNRYRVKTGHRQAYTRLRIDGIEA